jgi:hypothetical protein
MIFAFHFAYLLTAVLTIMQAVLLRSVIRQVMWLFQLGLTEETSETANGTHTLPVGSRIPGFKAQVLDTDQIIFSKNIVGKRTAFIFVTPADAKLASVRDGSLRNFLDRLSARLANSVYVVCSGTREDCGTFATRSLHSGRATFGPSSYVILEDRYGSLRRAFAVDRSPAAARVDEFGRIEQYGYPLEIVIDEVPASLVQQLVKTEADYSATFNRSAVLAAQEGERL